MFYLVLAFLVEQGLGILALSHRVAFSILPGVFISRIFTLSPWQAFFTAILVGFVYDVESTRTFGIFIVAYVGIVAIMKISEPYIASYRFFPSLALGLCALGVFYGVRFLGFVIEGQGFGSTLYIAEEALWNISIIIWELFLRTKRSSSHHVQFF